MKKINKTIFSKITCPSHKITVKTYINKISDFQFESLHMENK